MYKISIYDCINAEGKLEKDLVSFYNEGVEKHNPFIRNIRVIELDVLEVHLCNSVSEINKSKNKLYKEIKRCNFNKPTHKAVLALFKDLYRDHLEDMKELEKYAVDYASDF